MENERQVLSVLPKNLTPFGITNEDQANLDWIDIDKLKKVVEFVKKNFKKIDIYQKWCTSYHLKHIAETRLGFYLENGYMIAAMIIAGFEYKRAGAKSPNAWHKVSKRSVKTVNRENRNIPKPATA